MDITFGKVSRYKVEKKMMGKLLSEAYRYDVTIEGRSFDFMRNKNGGYHVIVEDYSELKSVTFDNLPKDTMSMVVNFLELFYLNPLYDIEEIARFVEKFVKEIINDQHDYVMYHKEVKEESSTGLGYYSIDDFYTTTMDLEKNKCENYYVNLKTGKYVVINNFKIVSEIAEFNFKDRKFFDLDTGKFVEITGDDLDPYMIQVSKESDWRNEAIVNTIKNNDKVMFIDSKTMFIINHRRLFSIYNKNAGRFFVSAKYGVIYDENSSEIYKIASRFSSVTSLVGSLMLITEGVVYLFNEENKSITEVECDCRKVIDGGVTVIDYEDGNYTFKVSRGNGPSNTTAYYSFKYGVISELCIIKSYKTGTSIEMHGRKFLLSIGNFFKTSDSTFAYIYEEGTREAQRCVVFFEDRVIVMEDGTLIDCGGMKIEYIDTRNLSEILMLAFYNCVNREVAMQKLLNREFVETFMPFYSDYKLSDISYFSPYDEVQVVLFRDEKRPYINARCGKDLKHMIDNISKDQSFISSIDLSKIEFESIPYLSSISKKIKLNKKDIDKEIAKKVMEHLLGYREEEELELTTRMMLGEIKGG